MGSDKELRKGLIRLAAAKPEFRSEILGVLKKTAGIWEVIQKRGQVFALFEQNGARGKVVFTGSPEDLRKYAHGKGLKFNKDEYAVLGGTWFKQGNVYVAGLVPADTKVGIEMKIPPASGLGSIPAHTQALSDEWVKSKTAAEEKWIQNAVKSPGALHKHFGVPEGEKIPKAKIEAELAKLKKKKEKLTAAESKLQKQLQFALNVGGLGKKAAVEPEFKIIVTQIEKRVTEDDPDRGAIGDPKISISETKTMSFRSFKEMLQRLNTLYDFPKEKESWMAFGDGRVVSSRGETEQGDIPGPGDIEAWKNGEQDHWIADFNVWLEFAKSYEPDADELADTFGIEKY